MSPTDRPEGDLMRATLAAVAPGTALRDGLERILRGNTGGLVVLRKFKAGHTIPAHTHAEANEWAYVLSGEWEESGTTYTTGALFFAPKGTRHGPHIARTEVISLTIFDGPLTVQ